jgi:hypothetical protein
MRKIFDDIRVVETGLGRNPVYVGLSSLKWAVFLMSLVAVVTLIATLFPQGMEDEFYLATFGERLFHVYDSLGLLAVLRSWWFMVLFVLLFAALVLCTHARVREGQYRGSSGTKLYETEFSVPKTSDDIMLIFPVLLSSIGFRRRRIIHDEKRTEVVAVRGVSPWVSSVLLHSSVGLLLVGLVWSYLFSWGGSLRLEKGRVSRLPASRTETRWSTFQKGLFPAGAGQDGSDDLRLELLQFTKEYSPAPQDLIMPGVEKRLPVRSVPRAEIVYEGGGEVRLLRDWQSRLRVTRGSRSRIIRVSAGRPQEVFGVSVSEGYFSGDVSLIRIRSDPGRTLLRLGAFFLVLFTAMRLYMYSYALRVEISGLRGGSSRLRIRMRSSGLVSSPPRVARRIAGLLAK